MTTYNRELQTHVLEELRTYFALPADKEFTYLDWNYRGDQLPYRLFKEKLDHLRMFTANEKTLGAATSNAMHKSLVKHMRANYQSDVKISHDAFSFAVIDAEVTSQLANIIDDIDRFSMPDFSKEVEERVQINERRRLELLGINQDGQINMEEFDTGNISTDAPPKAPVKIETDEEKEIRLNKMRDNILKNLVKDWRRIQKEVQKDIRYFRSDHILLQRTIDYLKTGGILMMILPVPMIDEDVAYKLANNFEDLRILFIKDKLDYSQIQKAIIIGKKKARSLQDRQLASLIARTKEIPQNRLRQSSGISLEDEAIQKEIQENPEKYTMYYEEMMIDRIYGEIERQETPLYTVPVAFAEDVNNFRIGPLTDTEILDTLSTSRMLVNFEKKYDDMFLEKQSVTPTPLHDGHIVMLLTSGLLNGYVGTGPNQHLVKGTAVKTIHEVNDVNEDGNPELTEKEFYNIAVTTLNADGEFKKIM